MEFNPVKDDRPTLAEVGIDKNLAHEARTLAKIPPQEFEQKIEDMKEHVGRYIGRFTSGAAAAPSG